MPGESDITARTSAVVLRYHDCWERRDTDGVLALFHPDIEYNNFFQNLCMRQADLRDYITRTMPVRPDEFLNQIDRIRVDGDTAFIQYSIAITLSERLAVFHSCEAITVRDGLVWRLNEYATLSREPVPAGHGAPARSLANRLGLSPRQLGELAAALEAHVAKTQPYLDPELDLTQLAAATGYTRNQISYLFNQVMGLTFYQYVSQKRLDYFLARLPTAQEASIDRLAFAAGFNSLSAFYRCFRQRMGVPPREYLQLMMKKP